MCVRPYLYSTIASTIRFIKCHKENCYIYVPLCVGGSKGKAGIQLKYIPEKRDTFEMYPGKVMHIIRG